MYVRVVSWACRNLLGWGVGIAMEQKSQGGGGKGDGEELRIFFAAMRGLTLIAKIKHEQGVQRPDESWTLPQLAHSFKKKL